MTDVLVGGVLFAVVNGLLLRTAHLAARTILPDAPPRVRLTATGIVSLAILILVVQLLSPFTAYTRGAALVAVAAIALAAEATLRPAVGPRDDWHAVARWFQQVTASRGAVLLVVMLVAVVLLAVRAAELPPLAWDSVTYHLTFASRFVQAASLVPMNAPYAMDRYDHFPKNGEIVTSWVLLPFHDDVLAGFMNIALIAFGWLATYSVARELELDPGDAALAATAVCTSPFLYAYATTQQPDVLVYAVLMSAVLFAFRYLKGAGGREAGLAFVAIGIAAGIKYTAVPLAAMLALVVIVAAARQHARARTMGRALAGLLGAALIVGALGGRQYVLNATTTGNPIYPLTIGAGGTALSRGSPFTEQQVREKGVGTRRDDLFQFVETFNYYPDWRNVVSAGPKYILLVPFALFALARPPRRQPGLVRLAVVLAVVGLAVAYLPADGFAALSRRFWPSSTPRFLVIYFALLALGGLSVLARLPGRRAEASRLLVAGFVVWDLLRADTSTAARVPLYLGMAALATAAIMAIARIPVMRFRRVAAASAAVAVVLLLAPLEARRNENRWRLYASETDVHPIPRDFVAGWEACDRPSAPETIALTAGWDRSGENWFFYPLMGRRLQNQATYVPLSRAGLPGTRDFARRENGNYDEWLAQLTTRRITVVFVQGPWPIEDAWMQEHPDLFVLRKGGAGFRIYDVRARGTGPSVDGVR